MFRTTLFAVVVSSVLAGFAGERKVEAEDCRYLPAPNGQKAGLYNRQEGQSGRGVLAYFQEGRIAAYGASSAAKWIYLYFATDSQGAMCPLEFYDGDKKLGALELPDTGSYYTYEEAVVRVDLPAAADLRLVAPNRPINIDYFILSDNEQAPALRNPPPPPVDELKTQLLAGQFGAFDEIVFATRSVNPEHWYANFSYYCYNPSRTVYGTEGRLCAYNLKTGKLRILLEDVEGGVRDPCVDYDAQTILFSYRPKGRAHYHLYTIGVDGTNLRQLTFGDYDDIEPAWLPDGDIVFVSSRARRWVNCWLTQVATIYRMKADGTGIRMLSANIEHDNTPWVLPDGRILYMRWEYVDRRQVTFHHLWTMNQDGTQHQVYQGNTYPYGVYLDAKPIPGTDDVIFSNSPGHGRAEHGGSVAVLSTKSGPDSPQNIRTVKGGVFYDPWAFSPACFMASDGRALHLMNSRGQSTKLFSLADDFGRDKVPDRVVHQDGTGGPIRFKLDAQLFEPRPIMKRARERVHADRTNPAAKTGEFYLENVLISRSMDGVKPGTVKKLLVMESLPKMINYTGGMDPLTYGGTFTLTRILGWVPVEEDGSAYFKAPALKSLFFVAVDAEGRAVKRMQSFTQVMPGERQGCVGCHERKTENTVRRASNMSKALARGPSEIDPTGRAFDVPDFPRDVQPVLDRSCVKCHNPDKRAGGVDLSGDHGVMFSQAYYNLIAWNQVLDGRNDERSDWPPYARGSGGSPLMAKISGEHHGVKVSPEDRWTIMQWLDASAPYPGTYGALGCGSIGGYHQNFQVVNNDKDRPAAKAAQDVLKRRCDTCHTKAKRIPHFLSDENAISFWTPSWTDPRLKTTSRHYVFNLTNPAKSLYLKAPLAKEAGGFGLCVDKEGKPVFASTDDPDYQKLLAMIDDGRQVLEKEKRFDMPGFRPPVPYLRELKRYGVLPESFDVEKDPADPYALDRLYWARDWTDLK